MAYDGFGPRIPAKHTSVLVMIDCRDGTHALADATQPQLHVTDLAATRGDGVFEAMLARDGVPCKPEAHLHRLQASAQAAELLDPGAPAWRDAIATALRAIGPWPEALVKLVLSRGPEGSGTSTAWVHVSDCSEQHDAARRDGIDVMLLDRGYDSTLNTRAPWLMMGAKTLSYAVNMAAMRHARRNGADDVIFTSSDGHILEGPTSSVVIACHREGRVLLQTPPSACGILAGTTQALLFDAAQRLGWRTETTMLAPADVYAAEGAWLVSSIRLAAPINRLDGRELPRSPALNQQLLALLDVHPA